MATPAASPPANPPHRLLPRLGLAIGATVGGFYVIVAAGAALEYSRQYLPEGLHLIVLAGYLVLLGYLLTWTATERSRRTNLPRIVEWFGPYGLVLLPLFLMSVFALVLASLTATLFAHGWVELLPGGGGPVTEASLKDFYLWHLLDLVPLVDVPKTLRWEEPVQYAQTRVGLLVLLYQALVVVPCIGALRWYWRERDRLRDARGCQSVEEATQ